MDLVQQRSKGFATVLAVGTAVPPQKISVDYMIDNYFRVTNTEHLTELKKKFAKICKWPFIYISFAISFLQHQQQTCMITVIGLRRKNKYKKKKNLNSLCVGIINISYIQITVGLYTTINIIFWVV